MNPHLHSNTTIVSINLKMNHLMLLIGENSNTTIVSINQFHARQSSNLF